jgi:hypothetical protein
MQKKNKQKKKTKTRLPLAQPMELAMLAAILRPSALDPAGSFKAALDWYCRAVLFAREKASSQIRYFLKQIQTESRRVKGRKQAEALDAKRWNETVDLDEARELLANPRKLAEKLNKLPAQLGMTVETPLHELPGFVAKSKTGRPLSYRTLKENVLKTWAYFALRYGVAQGDVIARSKFLEKMLANGRVPTFLLEGVLRYRHERKKEIGRTSWHTRKSSTQN